MPDCSPPTGNVSLESMRNSTDQILSNENYIDVKGTIGLLHMLFIVLTSWSFLLCFAGSNIPFHVLHVCPSQRALFQCAFLTCKRIQKWFSITFSHLLLLSFCSVLKQLKANFIICTVGAVPSHYILWNSRVTLRRLNISILYMSGTLKPQKYKTLINTSTQYTVLPSKHV